MAPGKAYTDHQFHSNSYTGPRPTPTIPKGGLFSIYAETKIPTPPIHPYTALLDLRSWHEWNSYIPSVLITKHPHSHSRSLKMEVGTFMTFTYQLTPTEKTESKEVVRHLEALKTRKEGNSQTGKYVTRIRWTMDNAGLLQPGFLMATERVCEIEELEDGTTVFRTWQTFSGLGAKFLRKKWESVLQERYLDFVDDLRKRSVRLYKAAKKEGGGVAEMEAEVLKNGNGEEEVDGKVVGKEVREDVRAGEAAAVGVMA